MVGVAKDSAEVDNTQDPVVAHNGRTVVLAPAVALQASVDL